MAMTTYPRIAKECANAYREKTGETELVKAQELPTLIENMKAAELPNGKVWKQSNITSGNFTAVAYGKGIYVATGANGIYWSEDGKTWTQSNVVDKSSMNDLIYVNGIFVASGTTVRYSSDGKTWAEGNKSVSNVFSMTYGNGIFVGGTINEGIVYSTDGKTWINSDQMTGSYRGVTYGNGIFIIGSYKANGSSTGVWWSKDGKAWTHSDNLIDNKVFSVLYTNGIFLAGCNDGIYWSEDGGMNWRDTGIKVNTLPIRKIIYKNGIFVAKDDEVIYYSFDGVEWDGIRTLDDSWALEYANGIFVTGHKYSSNITEWAESNTVNKNFHEIIHANDKFIAVGTSGIYYSETFLPDAPIGGG